MAQKIALAIFALFLSTVSAQRLECSTTSTTGGNAGGQGCVFPFTYQSKKYTECTDENYGSDLWCATTSNYDQDSLWGECICKIANTNAPGPGPTCTEATRDGGKCAPTFIYSGTTYSGCPTIDNSGTPWCSLTEDYDADRRWSNCATPLKCETPQTGTGCREKTVFSSTCASSFIYNGVTYNGCTTVDNGGVPWCSLTPNFDLNGSYSNCEVPLKCVTSGDAGPGCREKTFFGTDCAPSFIYGNKTYSGCITTNNNGVPWCSETENFDRDNLYARCKTPLQCTSEPDGDGCVEETSSGNFCAREYMYNNKKYVGCTKVDNGNTPWCALTEDYDRDKQYETCKTPLKCTTAP